MYTVYFIDYFIASTLTIHTNSIILLLIDSVHMTLV